MVVLWGSNMDTAMCMYIVLPGLSYLCLVDTCIMDDIVSAWLSSTVLPCHAMSLVSPGSQHLDMHSLC